AEDFGELEVIVARALAKRPADRYQSAAEMSAALDAAIAKRPSLGVIDPNETVTVEPHDVVTSAPIQYPNTLPCIRPVKARTDEVPALPGERIDAKLVDSVVRPLPRPKTRRPEPSPSRVGIVLAIVGFAVVGIGVAVFMLGGGGSHAAPPAREDAT